jgi:hypothetical protein
MSLATQKINERVRKHSKPAPDMGTAARALATGVAGAVGHAEEEFVDLFSRERAPRPSRHTSRVLTALRQAWSRRSATGSGSARSATRTAGTRRVRRSTRS